jgi:glycosyltransferase involved in cell wall biosynthesis
MSDAVTPKYSVIATVYNDAYLAEAFCSEVINVFKGLLKTDNVKDCLEIILVNDGSTNDSLGVLKNLCDRFAELTVIDLSRNFGQHVAIMCGYRHAVGNLVIRLNIDMQDPPREIPKLLKVIEFEDVDLVVGLQRERKSSLQDKITSRAFFFVFNYLIGSKIPSNTATLRVLNRKYVDAILSLQDKTPFLQGLESWVGFKVRYIETEHVPRADKKSSYTFLKRLGLALNASISFSDRPLRLAVYFGLLISAAGFFGFALIVLRRLIDPEILPGYTSTLAVVLFCSGAQIMVSGVCGLYIGKILFHVQNRPLYLIRNIYK